MKTRRGFTLIELVVAISLLAFGLALSFATLRGVTRAAAQSELVSRRAEQIRAVQGFVRTQINAALPIAFVFDADSGVASFMRVSQDKVEFVANMPGYMSRGGPYLQTLELVSGDKDKRLVFRQQLLTTEGVLDDELEPVLLLDGIAEGSFDVRTLDQKLEPGEWTPDWNVSARLPPMIRLRIRFADQARRWPELVVATRLGGAAVGADQIPLAVDPAVAK